MVGLFDTACCVIKKQCLHLQLCSLTRDSDKEKDDGNNGIHAKESEGYARSILLLKEVTSRNGRKDRRSANSSGIVDRSRMLKRFLL